MLIPTTTRTQPPQIQTLQTTLHQIGWEVQRIDIDLTGHTPRCEMVVAREDGRWLFLRGDTLGRFSMETWQRTIRLGMPDNRARNARLPLSPQIDDLFFGRRSFSGARVMLRCLCEYLVDNATTTACLTDVRDALRLTMETPITWKR